MSVMTNINEMDSLTFSPVLQMVYEIDSCYEVVLVMHCILPCDGLPLLRNSVVELRRKTYSDNCASHSQMDFLSQLLFLYMIQNPFDPNEDRVICVRFSSLSFCVLLNSNGNSYIRNK